MQVRKDRHRQYNIANNRNSCQAQSKFKHFALTLTSSAFTQNFNGHEHSFGLDTIACQIPLILSLSGQDAAAVDSRDKTSEVCEPYIHWTVTIVSTMSHKSLFSTTWSMGMKFNYQRKMEVGAFSIYRYKQAVLWVLESCSVHIHNTELTMKR